MSYDLKKKKVEAVIKILDSLKVKLSKGQIRIFQNPTTGKKILRNTSYKAYWLFVQGNTMKSGIAPFYTGCQVLPGDTLLQCAQLKSLCFMVKTSQVNKVRITV